MAAGAAVLAVGSGFALHRMTLPADPAGAAAQVRPQADPQGEADPAAEESASPTPRTDPADASPPPLKALRVRPKPTRESNDSGDSGGGGGTGGGTGGGGSDSTAPPSGGGGGGGGGGSTSVEAEVIRITNQERAKAGCSALTADSRLVVAARKHSADMAANNYFSHDSQDGRTFADRVRAAGYPSPGAENIARGYPTAAAVMDGWMNSDGHRRNILNCSLKKIGVGRAGGSGGPWWTQDFGF